MENTDYYNYFTQIEEHFSRKCGQTKLLSTLDWALIETWKNTGVPLETVLRGIDDAFGTGGRKKINSIAYCRQAVENAAERR